MRSREKAHLDQTVVFCYSYFKQGLLALFLNLEMSRKPGPLECCWHPTLMFSLVIALVVSLSACTIKRADLRIEDHVVMVDGMGDLVDPRGNIGTPDSGQHVIFKAYPNLQSQEEYFTRLFSSVNERTPFPSQPDKRRRILLFIHGGMNTARASIERVTKHSNKILEADAYPIFINWDSSLTSSYIDHLFFLRQGERVGNWCCKWMKGTGLGDQMAGLAGVLSSAGTAPFYATFDLLRGAVRMPIDIWAIWKEMIKAHVNGERKNDPGDRDKTCKESVPSVPVGITLRADRLLCAYHGGMKNSPAIAQGLDSRKSPEQIQQIGIAVLGGLTFMHQFSTLVSDIVGTGAWSSMNRRTTVMFHRDDDLSDGSTDTKPAGGIAQFMNAFREFLKKEGGKEKWEVVLVGHSMGAIIVNQMVRQFGHPLSDGTREPLFDTIVYMAAAASLRDYLNTIPPYLKEYGNEHGQNHREPRIFHLTLNDRAEADEQYLPITHPGSLLVWIDMFFARPDALLDYVAGRYSNLLGVMHLHDHSIRDRVSIKSFNYGKENKSYNPQTHGDFDEFPFWREDFWTVRGLDPFSVRRCEKEPLSSDLCPRELRSDLP